MVCEIDHMTLAVADLDRAFDFYKNVLGLKPLCRWERGAYFLIGNLWLCLSVDLQHIPSECYAHYTFSVSAEDFQVMRHRIEESNAVVLNDHALYRDSLCFLDPDGHKLEIHTGSWQGRLVNQQASIEGWQEAEWYI